MGSRPTLGAVNSQAEKTNTSHPFLVIVTLFVLRVRYSEKMRSFIPLLLVLALDGARGIKINPCCPEGEIYSLLGSEEEPRPGCKPYAGELPPFIAQWSDGEDRAVELSEGTGGQYRCKGSLYPTSVPANYGDGVGVEINTTTGWLLITDLNGTAIDSYSNDDFCGYYTDISSKDGQLEYTYTVCFDTLENPTEKKIRDIFYPIALLVSAFFLLVTIILYLTVGSLKKTIFSKITLGFLINAFICYLVLGIKDFQDLSPDGESSILGRPPCVVLGYIIHHTFLAYFFWMTAMAFNIAKSLSTLQLVRNQKSSWKSFLVYFLYAQGIPILISVFVFLMDNLRPNDILLPNMGTVECFVGSEFSLEKTFFQTSQFLYYYLIVIVLISFNIICFLVTAIHLHKHWHDMKNVQTSCSDGLVDHFSIIVKLSVIMGVPWILDIVSAGLEYQYGSAVFELSVILDILNLLSGILIFLSLICKPSVWTQIKKSYSKKIDKTSLHLTKSNTSTTSTV